MGVVLRKSIYVEELTKMMLNETNLPKHFWVDVVSIACYVMKCSLIRPILKLMPYELYRRIKLNISHLHVFECKCFLLKNEKDNLGKLYAKAYEGILIGYSTLRKALRVLKKITLTT